MAKFNAKKVALAVVGIALGVGADQLTKYWAKTTLVPLPERTMTVIPGIFSFEYVENPNVAFGLGHNLPESYKTTILLVLTLALTVALIIAMVRAKDFASRLGFGTVLAGALGNICDRAFNEGRVVDFILWHGGFRWPNFNVADVLVCTGVGILLLFGGRKKKKPALEEGLSR